MKVKMLTVVLVIVLVVLLGFIYLFIPSTIKLSQVQTFTIPPGALMRCFNDQDKMKEWWPGKENSNGKTFQYERMSFQFSGFNITAIQKVVIHLDNKDSLTSFVTLNQLGRDTSFLFWKGGLKTGLSPVNRVRQYLKGRQIEKAMHEILASVSGFAANNKNIYGIAITRGKVPDSVFISEKKYYRVYPGVKDIYTSIHSLSAYIAGQNVKQTNEPICNITPADSTGFNVIVAIPINKTIPETATKKIKNMLYNGNILVSETTGGDYTINAALAEQKNYIEDYRLTPVVLPYQSLITDRERVTDTSLWRTKVCYPIY